MSLLLLNRPWCVAGVATPPVPEPYERFRPAYDLPFDELGVRIELRVAVCRLSVAQLQFVEIG